MAHSYTYKLEDTAVYRALSPEKQKALQYDIQNNKSAYSSANSGDTVDQDILHRSYEQLRTLPDEGFKFTPVKNKYTFDAFDTKTGAENPVWREAYNNLGIFRSFLKIGTGGSPSEDNTPEGTLSKLAYQQYYKNIADITLRNQRMAYKDLVFQKDGVVDNGKTKAFQQLTDEEKDIVYDFGVDGAASGRVTSEEQLVYDKFLRMSAQINAESSWKDLVFTKGDGTEDTAKTKAFQELSAADKRVITSMGDDWTKTGSMTRAQQQVRERFEARVSELREREYEDAVYTATQKARAEGGTGIDDETKATIAKQYGKNESDVQKDSIEFIDDPARVRAYNMSRGRSAMMDMIHGTVKAPALKSTTKSAAPLVKFGADKFTSFMPTSTPPTGSGAGRFIPAEAKDGAGMIGTAEEKLAGIEAAKQLTAITTKSNGTRPWYETVAMDAEVVLKGIIGSVYGCYNALSTLILSTEAMSNRIQGFDKVAETIEADRNKRYEQYNSFIGGWEQGINDRYHASDENTYWGLFSEQDVNGFVSSVAAFIPTLAISMLTAGTSFAASGLATAAGASTAAGVALTATGTAAATVGNMGLTYAALSATGANAAAGYAESGDGDAAMLYGITSGCVEVITEKMFSGIPMLNGGAFDAVVENAAKKITKNPMVQAAVLRLIDINGEGVEEVITTALDPFLRRIYIDPNADAATIEDYLSSYIGGALCSAVFSEAFDGIPNSAENIKAHFYTKAAVNLNEAIAQTEATKSQYWDQSKVDTLAQYAEGIADPNSNVPLVRNDTYMKVVNSRTELTQAQARMDVAQQNMMALMQDMAKPPMKGQNRVNLIRSYSAELNAAQNKLMQTQKAMLDAQSGYKQESIAARTAFEKQAQARQEAEAQQTAADTKTAQTVFLNEEQRAMLNTLANGSLPTERMIKGVMPFMQVAQPEAMQLYTTFNALQKEAAALEQETKSLADAKRGGANQTSLKTRETALRVRSENVEQLRTAFAEQAQEYTQAANTGLLAAMEPYKGMTPEEINIARALNSNAPVQESNAQSNAPANATPEAAENTENQAVPEDNAQLNAPLNASSAIESAINTPQGDTAERAFIAPLAQESPASAALGEMMAQGSMKPDENGVLRSMTTGSQLVFLPSSNYTKLKKLRSFTDIMQGLEDAFNAHLYKTGGVRAANRRAGAKGVYNTRTEALATLKANDIPTSLHELGHHLDKLYGFSQMQGVQKVIDALPDNFKRAYKPQELPGEAVAEITNMYMFNHEAAAQLWPEYVSTIETTMRKEAPAQYKALQRASNDLLALTHSTTAEQVDTTIVSHAKKNPATASERMEATVALLFDENVVLRRMTETVKENGRAVKIEEDPYSLERLANHAAGTAEHIITNQLVDPQGRVIGDSFAKCLEGLKTQEESDNLDSYLKMQRALDEEGRGDVLPDTIPLDDARAEIARLEQQYPNLKIAADKLYKSWQTFIQSWLVDTGYLTQASWDEWKAQRPHYVPVSRVMDAKSDAPLTGSHDNANPVTRRFKGSTRDTYSPTESLMAKCVDYVTMVRQGEVMRAIDNLYETGEGMGTFLTRIDNPTELQQVSSSPVFSALRRNTNEMVRSGALTQTEANALVDDMFDDIGQTIIGQTVRTTTNAGDVDVIAIRTQNGETHFYKVGDTNFLKFIKGMESKQLDFVTNILSKVTHAKAALTTSMNIFFAATNVARDAQEAYEFGSYAIPFSATGEWLKSAASEMNLNPDDVHNLYKALGGGGGLIGSVRGEKNIKQLVGDVLPYKNGSVAKALRKAGGKYGDIIEAAETATREAEFRKCLKDGKTPLAAFLASQDVTTDFSRRGSAANKLGALMVFYNAEMQGLYKSLNMLTGRYGYSETGKGDPKAIRLNFRKLFLAGACASALNEIMGAALSGGGDEKDELSDWELLSEDIKNNYYMIPTGDGQYIRLPKPNGQLSKVATLIGRYGAKLAMEGDPSVLVDLLGDSVSDSIPFVGDLAGDLIKGTKPGFTGDSDAGIPSNIIGASFIDAAMNRTWYGGTIVPGYLEDKSPENQYNEKTSWFGKVIGKIINQSPMKVDYTLDQGTGILADVAIPISTGDTQALLNVLTNRFTADALYNTDVLNSFYDTSNALSTIVKNGELAQPNLRGNLSPQEKALAVEEAKQYQKTMNDAADEISGLNDRIKQLEAKGKSRDDDTVRTYRRDQLRIAFQALLEADAFYERWGK